MAREKTSRELMFEYILYSYRTLGRFPSQRQLAAAGGLSSTHTVRWHLANMIKDGEIERIKDAWLGRTYWCLTKRYRT